jgi:mannosyltransferase OCH1-like enzyme
MFLLNNYTNLFSDERSLYKKGQGGQEVRGMKEEESDRKCPQEGYVYMHDRLINVAPDNNKNTRTTTDRLIPKKIHFIMQSRCIPQELAIQLQNQKAFMMDDHSILFHDAEDIEQNVLSKSAAELGFEFTTAETYASISKLYHCQSDPRAKLDIARFLILWDQGGVAMDLDQLPAVSAFLNFNADGSTVGISNGTDTAAAGESNPNSKFIVDDKDECVFEVSGVDDRLVANPRFMACAPKHPALYVGIMLFLSSANSIDRCYNDYCLYGDNGYQSSMYMGSLSRFLEMDGAPGTNAAKTYSTGIDGFFKSSLTRIHSDRMGIPSPDKSTITVDDDLFTNFNLTDATKKAIELKNLSPYQFKEQCKDLEVFENDSFEVDLNSLLKVTGDVYNASASVNTTIAAPLGPPTCGSPLHYIPSRYVHGSINGKRKDGGKRKIPKLVHMTSKSHCVSERFKKNIELWYFDDHSIFMHDDDAVDRLFDRGWPEFPLLKECLSCIYSGAGKADLWRYLLLWEYGGIYTDIDNAPGQGLLNGTLITDHDVDSFFEQERGRFPSQYFMAASPHHPVMYFMVMSTIDRLLDVRNISDQYVPFVTGPGATKTAVIRAVGTGYPAKGHYVGVYNRTMTVVGSSAEAKQGLYLRRDSVVHKGRQYGLMNMTHYNDKKKVVQKHHSCFLEIHDNFTPSKKL